MNTMQKNFVAVPIKKLIYQADRNVFVQNQHHRKSLTALAFRGLTEKIDFCKQELFFCTLNSQVPSLF